jgi:hypothetical protein
VVSWPLDERAVFAATAAKRRVHFFLKDGKDSPASFFRQMFFCSIGVKQSFTISLI